jgi:hypothetical protein
MDVADVLKNLSIDTWYKALMVLGGGVFAASDGRQLKLPIADKQNSRSNDN